MSQLSVDVQRILLHDWDPIGIQDIPEAQDEYDIYVIEICQMLSGGQTSISLYDHLRYIEKERMGLAVDAAITKQAAENLIFVFLKNFTVDLD